MTKLLLVLLFPVLAFGQNLSIKNFDTVLSYDQSNVVIQPPQGETWILKEGSFQIETVEAGQSVTVYTQWGNDPGLCTNLMMVELVPPSTDVFGVKTDGVRWIPIVGGFVNHPNWGRGLGPTKEITLVYPMRLVIHLGKAKNPVKTWTRFTIESRGVSE